MDTWTAGATHTAPAAELQHAQARAHLVALVASTLGAEDVVEVQLSIAVKQLRWDGGVALCNSRVLKGCSVSTCVCV
jgi:hypothetical protein